MKISLLAPLSGLVLLLGCGGQEADGPEIPWQELDGPVTVFDPGFPLHWQIENMT